jgi:hypothetical protein
MDADGRLNPELSGKPATHPAGEIGKRRNDLIICVNPRPSAVSFLFPGL